MSNVLGIQNNLQIPQSGKRDEQVIEQKYRWDEENRLLAADENYSIKREQSQICLSYAERENNRPKVNGFVSNYWYDAEGERPVKTSGENEAIYVNYRASRTQWQTCLSIAETQPIIRETNSGFSGGNTGTTRFTLYVSPYYVASPGGRYTKHVYIGGQRVVSKLGQLDRGNVDPRITAKAGGEAPGVSVDYAGKYAQQLEALKDNYRNFDLPYNGADNTDPDEGRGFCCDGGRRGASGMRAAVDNFHEADAYQRLQFYYHSDHLGNSTYITNLDAEVTQHIEYVPFGEVFIEERNNTWNTPYLFNAKELDEETGLYYYGARYYDPRLSLWMSTDPMEEKYPNISSYCYTYNNPIKFIDPDGEKLVLAGSRQDRMKVLKFLQRLTNDNLFVNRKTGEVTIGGKRWDNRNKKLKAGTSLLRDVINNKHTTTIYQNTNDERSATTLEKWGRKEFKHPAGSLPGSDAQIDIDLSPTTNTVRNPTTSRSENGYTPAEITLGHELIHSLRYMEGISTLAKEDYKYTDGAYLVTEKKQFVEELQTIGLGRYRKKYKYTENMLREEHNLQQRLSHISND